MIIELIRHGDTPWMAERRYQGRSDIPLSEAGKKKLQASPHKPAVVYVSGMKRAVQTAEAIFPDAEQIVIPAFNEMDFGDFEGKSADEMADDPSYRAWVDGNCEGQCPGGESKDAFSERVCTAFSALCE